MTPTEKDKAVKEKMLAMTEAAQTLNDLAKYRRETLAQINKKAKDIEHTVAKEVADRREKESQRRLSINSKQEQQQQQLTSSLMLELMLICAEDDVPRYVKGIAKVLDNFQGGINTIRSNSNWLSELISLLTDQMRNFDCGQKKIESKLDFIVEKVRSNKTTLPVIIGKQLKLCISLRDIHI